MGNSDQSPPFSEFSRGRVMGVGIPLGPVYVTKPLSLHISGSFALVAAKRGLQTYRLRPDEPLAAESTSMSGQRLPFAEYG